MKPQRSFRIWLAALVITLLLGSSVIVSRIPATAQGDAPIEPQAIGIELLGGDHGGNDWIISNNTFIAGVHTNVGRFVIQPNVTVQIQPLTNGQYGSVEINAKEIVIHGRLSATAAGYLGGAGGKGKDSGNPYCGGNGTAGSVGMGTFKGFGGTGGVGNNGTNEQSPNCRYANGGNGGVGNKGGYLADGSNGETPAQLVTDDVFMGSGGGGGGGGAAGSRFGENNGYVAGTGGGGGAGGRGAGFIKLLAQGTLQIPGQLEARGNTTGNGGNGGPPPDYVCRTNEERNMPAFGGSGGDPTISGGSLGGLGRLADFYCPHPTGPSRTNTKGGNGGNGGGGAGGGILLHGRNVNLSGGTIDTRGGRDVIENGGTLKIRYDESYAAGQYLVGNVHIARIPPSATITILKDAQPDHNQDFTFYGPLGMFKLDDAQPDDMDGINRSITYQFNSGKYTFSEETVASWRLSSAVCVTEGNVRWQQSERSVNIDIGAQAKITCTFTNQQVAPSRTTITIAKDAQPDSIQDFTFYGPFGKFKLDDAKPDDNDGVPNSIIYNVEPGNYNFSEATQTSWYLAAINCNAALGKATPNTTNRMVTINPDLGDQITCTFVNQRRVNIQATKFNDLNGNSIYTPNEPTLPGWEMVLRSNQNVYILGKVTDNNGSTVFNNYIPGDYKLCETPQSRWVNTLPGVNDASLGVPCYTLNLQPGQNASVLFGNTQGAVVRPLEEVDLTSAVTISELADINEPEGELPSQEGSFNQQVFLPVVNR